MLAILDERERALDEGEAAKGHGREPRPRARPERDHSVGLGLLLAWVMRVSICPKPLGERGARQHFVNARRPRCGNHVGLDVRDIAERPDRPQRRVGFHLRDDLERAQFGAVQVEDDERGLFLPDARQRHSGERSKNTGAASALAAVEILMENIRSSTRHSTIVQANHDRHDGHGYSFQRESCSSCRPGSALAGYS